MVVQTLELDDAAFGPAEHELRMRLLGQEEEMDDKSELEMLASLLTLEGLENTLEPDVELVYSELEVRERSSELDTTGIGILEPDSRDDTGHG